MIVASIRALVSLAVCIALVGLSRQIDAQNIEKFQSPQTFYALSDATVMYAEPSDSGYPTGEIAFGQSVEAYAVVDGGWVAIRPPAGQIDWLAAEAAHLLSGGQIAEVIQDGAPAWIDASDAAQSQLKWQMRLRAGQQVRVVKQKLEREDDGRQFAWYQIEPPAGEYRWIRRAALSTAPPRQRTSTMPSDANGAAVVTASYNQSEAIGEEISAAEVTEVYEEPIQLAPGERIIEEQSLQSVLEPGEYLPPKLMGQAASHGYPSEIIAAPPLPAGAGGTATQLVTGPRPLISITPVAPATSCRTCEGSSPCETCSQPAECAMCGEMACETCDPTPPPPVHHIVKPLGRLLGLVGLGIVEADRLSLPCGGCAQTSCPHCVGQPIPGGSPAAIGTLPSRFDTLPRPLPADVEVPVERSLLLEELSEQRQILREQISQVGEERSTDRPLLNKFRQRLPAGVQIGKPQSSLLGSWQGLGAKDDAAAGEAGVQADELQLDVSPPSFTDDTPVGGDAVPAQKASRVNPSDQTRREGPSEPNESQIGLMIVEAATAELTTIVAGPTESWRLDPLRRDLQTVIDESADPIVRGEARLLLERVDEFDAFRLRWLRNHSRQTVDSTPPSADYSGRLAVSPASYQTQVPPSGEISIAADADANGYLVSVRSQRPDYPQFALTDRAGNLVAYVEAKPGMSLQPYLDQPVAIYGQRGTNTLLAARSIRVERIVRVAP